MKAPVKLFSLLAVIIILTAATGCDSGNGGDSVAFTEIEFADDSVPWADIEEDLLIVFLEPAGSDSTQDDTGSVGIDEIPVRYKKTQTRTFCWEDDDADAMHFMELRDSDGSLILTIEANGDCVTEVIEKGDYVMTLHNDGSSGETLPVFIIPHPDKNRQARETDGLFNGLKAVIARTLKGIQNTISKEAIAQNVQESIDTLLKTRSCVQCNLRDANLYGKNLKGVNLTGANLNFANLSFVGLDGANLTDANLSSANLQHSYLNEANLNRADLSYADLRNAHFPDAVLTDADLGGARSQDADFDGADLTRANLSGVKLNDATLRGADLSKAILHGSTLRGANLSDANLTDADMAEVDLTGAILTGAILTGADFHLAVWCDGGCTCTFFNSVGTCGGCQPAEEVCTGH